ncbi:signal peptidase I [Nocardioides sp. SYSU D00038]|uniref:signal peptidase I n=1 Tax=Nocardioides sp. SYSU D00038 TaxID=2812554 RepID=UPI0019680CFC|nr:signal peptidase I [Nocardioides sp. SYSU D00038]
MTSEQAPPATSSDPGGDPAERKRASLPVWQESLLLLGFALVLAVVIKAFLVQAFYIPSESMEPGLVKNDRILVQKPSYWFGEPERGDVVVFEDPGGWLGAADAGPEGGVTGLLAKVGLYPEGGHLVKRVIGTAGDVITCCDADGRISVNGQALDEDDYVTLDRKKAKCNGPMTGNCSWQAGPVPEGHVFVMGDHRDDSADSTVHMCTPEETDCVSGQEFVPVDLVVGKVFALVWPLSHFSGVGRADSFDDVPDPEK